MCRTPTRCPLRKGELLGGVGKHSKPPNPGRLANPRDRESPMLLLWGSYGPSVALGSSLVPHLKFLPFLKQRLCPPPEINEMSVRCQELFKQKEFTDSWSTLSLSLFPFNQGLAREKRHYIIKAISHWLLIPQGEGFLSSGLVLLSVICSTEACPVTSVSRFNASYIIR